MPLVRAFATHMPTPPLSPARPVSAVSNRSSSSASAASASVATLPDAPPAAHPKSTTVYAHAHAHPYACAAPLAAYSAAYAYALAGAGVCADAGAYADAHPDGCPDAALLCDVTPRAPPARIDSIDKPSSTAAARFALPHSLGAAAARLAARLASSSALSRDANASLAASAEKQASEPKDSENGSKYADRKASGDSEDAQLHRSRAASLLSPLTKVLSPILYEDTCRAIALEQQQQLQQQSIAAALAGTHRAFAPADVPADADAYADAYVDPEADPLAHGDHSSNNSSSSDAYEELRSSPTSERRTRARRSQRTSSVSFTGTCISTSTGQSTTGTVGHARVSAHCSRFSSDSESGRSTASRSHAHRRLSFSLHLARALNASAAGLERAALSIGQSIRKASSRETLREAFAATPTAAAKSPPLTPASAPPAVPAYAHAHPHPQGERPGTPVPWSLRKKGSKKKLREKKDSAKKPVRHSLLAPVSESDTAPRKRQQPQSQPQSPKPTLRQRSSTMNFIFKSKQRTPAELVKHLRDTIARLDNGSAGSSSGSGANGASLANASAAGPSSAGGMNGGGASGGGGSSDSRRKAAEDISKTLFQMKAILYGDGENSEPQPEMVAQLAQEVYNHNILHLLVANIWRFEFEAKKDVSQIFNNLLRRQIGSRLPTVEYLTQKPDIIFTALRGYENPDVALNTGIILREILRHEPLAKILLHSDKFYTFPDYIEKTTFGISCDAFANFKECLTKHKPMVAEYLERDYDRFFTMYTGLLQSPNYVTKRQSLKLLGEILLDRTNFNVMTRYISSEENLKLMMNLLKDKSKNIQFEAFHVFKVFVANPKKPPVVENILRRNRERLVAFLSNFHNDKEDEQFVDEKQYVLQIIESTGQTKAQAA